VPYTTLFRSWKVTVVNWLFAAAFLASAFFGERTLIQRMMGENLTLPEGLWRRLNWAWTGFFTAMGALNLYVAYGFSEEVWVNFKLFGLLGLTLAFALGQGVWLANKLPPQADGPDSPGTPEPPAPRPAHDHRPRCHPRRTHHRPPARGAADRPGGTHRRQPPACRSCRRTRWPRPLPGQHRQRRLRGPGHPATPP